MLYDDAGRLKSQQDSLGKLTTYRIDAVGVCHEPRHTVPPCAGGNVQARAARYVPPATGGGIPHFGGAIHETTLQCGRLVPLRVLYLGRRDRFPTV